MRSKDPNAETVGSLEKKFGFPPGTFRNPNGRDMRSDKLVETLRKEWRRRLRQAQKRKQALLPATRDLFADVEAAPTS